MACGIQTADLPTKGWTKTQLSESYLNYQNQWDMAVLLYGEVAAGGNMHGTNYHSSLPSLSYSMDAELKTLEEWTTKLPYCASTSWLAGQALNTKCWQQWLCSLPPLQKSAHYLLSYTTPDWVKLQFLCISRVMNKTLVCLHHIISLVTVLFWANLR